MNPLLIGVCVMKLPLTLWTCVLMCVNANLLTFGTKVAFKALLIVCIAATYIHYVGFVP